ncbi:MAG TPA: hypothetical protein VHN19_02745 [Burkholderiales bacterium]|jgi:hypothetical protein|nr:hypothetical protein [Burkholderiales bacterium]
MDSSRQQRLSATMGAVRELIVRDLRAAGEGGVPSARTLSMALEMLEVLWAELRQLADERERRAKA